MQELEFLGQWVTIKGVAPIKGKLNVVREWETPTSVTDIRSFLGFANYYHRFVPGYASIPAPLTMLTKKGVLWHWGPLQCSAFVDLKSSLCAAPLLIYPDPSTSIHISVWRFWRCCWRSIDAGSRWRPATSSILAQSIQTYWTIVLGIWKWVGCNRILLYSMAPLLERLSWWCHGGDRS